MGRKVPWAPERARPVLQGLQQLALTLSLHSGAQRLGPVSHLRKPRVPRTTALPPSESHLGRLEMGLAQKGSSPRPETASQGFLGDGFTPALRGMVPQPQTINTRSVPTFRPTREA